MAFCLLTFHLMCNLIGLTFFYAALCDYLHLIYPHELEVKIVFSLKVSFLPYPSHLNGQREEIEKTQLYDIRDDFTFQ